MDGKAFSRTELLVVFLIIGFSLAIIFPVLRSVRKDADARVCAANIRGLVAAMTTYEVRENDGKAVWSNDSEEYSIAVLQERGYLSIEPFCPCERDKVNPAPYIISGGSGTGSAPVVKCPNADKFPDHVWPRAQKAGVASERSE